MTKVTALALASGAGMFAMTVGGQATASGTASASVPLSLTVQTQTASLTIQYLDGGTLPSTPPGTPDSSLSSLNFPVAYPGTSVSPSDSVQVTASANGYTSYVLDLYSGGLTNGSTTVPASDITGQIWQGGSSGAAISSLMPESFTMGTATLPYTPDLVAQSIASYPYTDFSTSIAVPSGAPAGAYTGSISVIGTFQ